MRFIDLIEMQFPAWDPRCVFGSAMCFIAMERCEGGSLVQWVERMKRTGRRTTAAEASVIAAQLVSALSFCHDRNIGHFDLKPGNVFLKADFIEV